MAKTAETTLAEDVQLSAFEGSTTHRCESLAIPMAKVYTMSEECGEMLPIGLDKQTGRCAPMNDDGRLSIDDDADDAELLAAQAAADAKAAADAAYFKAFRAVKAAAAKEAGYKVTYEAHSKANAKEAAFAKAAARRKALRAAKADKEARASMQVRPIGL